MTDGVVILRGDVRDIAATLDAEIFDGCLCDPPYGLSFMGKKWDYDVPSVETWAAVLGALKPGAHLLAFAGTRTQHRMAVRIEDAGFEIRDMIAWLYGSGFPKSHNLRGEFDGYGTALKPALEPITVARKPLCGTVAANILRFGTGALNIDGCRVGGEPWKAHRATGLGSVKFFTEGDTPTIDKEPHGLGRWPANLIHDGSEEVVAGFPETTSGAVAAGTIERGKDALRLGAFGGREMPERAIDSGSAARFFYCAKASRSEREAGLREAGLREAGAGSLNMRTDAHAHRTGNATAPARNHHPTVKPIALAEYLARLILPPKRADGKPRRLLVPFSGSGSEIIGALRAGWDEVVGIELSPEYAEIAEARIAHWTAGQQDLAL